MKTNHFREPIISLHLFLGLFLFSAFATFGATKTVKFSVDLSKLISQKLFNPQADQVYVYGSFNNWGKTNQMIAGSDNIYSATIPLNENSWQEYKYCISTPGAANDGLEKDFPIRTFYGSLWNRRLQVGTNDLNLPVVYYNDEDMVLTKSTTHFNFYCTSQEKDIINDYSSRLEQNYTRIVSALQATVTEKINIYIYKNLDALHLANGYPESGESSTGSAWGKNLITTVSPTKVDYNGSVDVLVHEFTHCVNAWKTKITLPGWLNEGVACYYGRQISTKDWIKTDIQQFGKPKIDKLFTDSRNGYPYSYIVAYFIIKTKGEAAMARFVENMNYTDIGYANLDALQSAWEMFLDSYLDLNKTTSVKFSVDMAAMIQAGYFNPATHKVFVKGDFNWWNPRNQLTLESGTVYSTTIPIVQYGSYQYKFFVDNPSAPNAGLEFNVNQCTAGSRWLEVENSNVNAPVAAFKYSNTDDQTGIDMALVQNRINVLKLYGLPHTAPAFSFFNYSFKKITAAEYDAQKPSNALPFDIGFVATDGTINVSEPTTAAQKEVFADISNAALYYLCQSYIYFFYQTREMPLLLKVGFPAYESGLNITDAAIKTAINKYGGSFASFDVLNNSSTFAANNGVGVAMAFGEFMKVFKNWGFPCITSVKVSSFDVYPDWYSITNLQGLLDDFNRYCYARFQEPNENLRIKVVEETEHFRFYTRPVDAAVNFPRISKALEDAYKEYNTNYGIKAFDKLIAFTLADCADAIIEGISCDPATANIGGTAGPFGVHFGCTSKVERVNDVVALGRHELAHAFQGLLPVGAGTQWLGEGFAFFSDAGPLNSDYSNAEQGPGFWKQLTISSLERGTKFFGHRPTYEDTKIYPGYETDYGYKYLGYFLNDFIYRKGGYSAVKNVQLDDLSGYQKMGYSSGQAFMDDFYFDFDVRVQNIPMLTLKTPVAEKDLTSTPVSISWTSLKANVKLNVLVSTDNKTSWTEVASKTTQTTCTWNAGIYTGKFFLKFTAPDNLNIETVLGPFNLTDPTTVSVKFPNGGEYLIAGDTTRLQWDNTIIPKIKLEYSENNGTSWNTIETNVNSSASFYKWLVPSETSNQYKVRISDATNAAKNDVSEKVFTVLKSNTIGGPYLYDENTLLLLHFDNDLANRAYASGDANGTADNVQSDASRTTSFGNTLRTSSPVTVKHTPNLNLSGDWTIEAWVKLNSLNANAGMYILSKPGDSNSYESNYSLEINPWWGNIFHGFYFSGAGSRIGKSLQACTLNEWYHVAYIRDTKNAEIRMIIRDKNRKKIAEDSQKYTSTTTYLNSKDLFIGTDLDGYIDELRISNVVRSFISTGIDDQTANKDMRVFPNPTKGLVHLEWNVMTSETVDVQVITISGQTVCTDSFSAIGNTTLDLSNLPKGVYFIQLKNKSQLSTQKIILD